MNAFLQKGKDALTRIQKKRNKKAGGETEASPVFAGPEPAAARLRRLSADKCFRRIAAAAGMAVLLLLLTVIDRSVFDAAGPSGFIPPKAYQSAQVGSSYFMQSDRLTLRTVPVPLTVDSVLFSGDQNSVAIDGSFTLVFSGTIDEKQLKKSLHIVRAPKDAADKTDLLRPYQLTCQRNVAVISPVTYFEYGTEYTISLPAGFSGADGGVLLRDYTAKFHTQSPVFSLTLKNQDIHSVAIDEPIPLDFALDSKFGNQQIVDVRLYLFNNYKQYLTALRMDTISSSFHLTELSAQSVILQNGENHVQLTPPDAGGFYLVKVTYIDPKTNETMELFKCVNVVQLQVYLQTLGDETLVWVNDAKTHRPAVGYKVAFSGRTSEDTVAAAVTDASGIAAFTYQRQSDENQRKILTVYDPQGTPLYFDTTDAFGGSTAGPSLQSERFYSFFYTDRELYHPTDTVRYWGYVRAHASNQKPLPQTVTILFSGMPEKSISARILPDGTFSGQISFEALQSAQYELKAKLVFPSERVPSSLPEEEAALQPEEITIAQKELEVKAFDKPDFVLTSSVSKPLYYANDLVEVSITPAFYDGAPLPHYPVRVLLLDREYGETIEAFSARTDNEGVARISYRPKPPVPGQTVSRVPQQIYYLASIQNDGETISHQGSFFYLPADVTMQAAVSPNRTGNLDLTVQAAFVDEEKKIPYEQLQRGLTSGDSESNAFELLAGAPAEVDLTIQADVYYRDKQGEYRSETRTYAVRTQNGKAVLHDLLEKPFDTRDYAYATLSVACVDNNLNTVNASFTWQNGKGEARMEAANNPPKGYSLDVRRGNQTVPSQESAAYMGYSRILADDGELLHFSLCKDGKPAKNEGRIFYTILQDSILQHGIVEGQEFTLRQSVLYADNFYVAAAYFDGRVVYPVRIVYVGLNRQSVKLHLDITTDRQTYHPADTAAVRVRVTDQYGTPMRGSVCISVVEEAVFDLREQAPKVPESLFAAMTFHLNSFSVYTTSGGDSPGVPGAMEDEKGGGMEAYGSSRKDFQDTAFFAPLVTDANGQASVAFKLPDTLTAWRITAISIGSNLYSGSAEEHITVTRPFFTNSVLSSQYLEGDGIVIQVQGQGTALQRGRDITYQVTVTGAGKTVKTAEHTAPAFSPAAVQIGTLDAGDYTAVSASSYQNYRDTVKLPVTVKKSALETVIQKPVAFDQLGQLHVSRYPVTLRVYDKAHLPFYQNVDTLLTRDGYRTDRILARYTAQRVLFSHAASEMLPQSGLTSATAMCTRQNADGGICLYPNETPSPRLTADCVLIAPDLFDAHLTLRYLRDTLKNKTLSAEDKAAVYAALAALDSKAAKDIHTILEDKTQMLSPAVRLYYVTGLACAGDTANAFALYEEVTGPLLRTDGTKKQLVYPGGASVDESCTVRAWMAAAALGIDDADAFAAHFAALPNAFDFERMFYIARYQKQVPSPAVLIYTQNGAVHSLPLGGAGQASLTLSKEAFETFRFTQVPEQAALEVSYIGPPEDAAQKPSDRMQIKKEILLEQDGIYTTALTIDFDKGTPAGEYNISEWIPSNMRFVAVADMDANDSLRGYTQEQQNLYFRLYRGDEGKKRVVIRYQTRKVSDAATVSGRTYLFSLETGEHVYSEKPVT